MKEFTCTIVSFLAVLFGIDSLKPNDFNPIIIFFYLAIIIGVAVLFGIVTEAGFDKLKKARKKHENFRLDNNGKNGKRLNGNFGHSHS